MTDKDKELLTKERKLTTIQLKLWSSLLPKDTFLTIEQSITEELLKDAVSGQEMIKLLTERLSAAIVSSLKDMGFFTKEGKLTK